MFDATSKRAVGIIVALATVTFGLVYYLNAPTSHTPSRASRAAAPESPKPLAVRKRKIAGVGKLHRGKPAITKGFSEREYRLLRRRYKPDVQTARGAVNAQGLKVIASGTRRLMLGESTPTGLKLGRKRTSVYRLAA